MSTYTSYPPNQLRNKLIWVNASAGTGKTKSLTDRVISLMLADTNPQNILCITFTKTATSEMQTRITGIICRWSKISDNELRQEIADIKQAEPTNITANEINKARALFDAILRHAPKVTTIHEFCSNIIMNFSVEAQVKSNVKIIEEAESKILMREAISEFLRNSSTENHDLEMVLLSIADFYETISNLALSHPIPNPEFLTNEIESLKKELGVVSTTQHEISHSKPIIDLLSEKERQNITDDKGNINIAEYKSLFFTKTQQKRQRFTKSVPKEVMNDECNRLATSIEHNTNLQIMNQTSALIRILIQIQKIYRKLKQRNSYLDFNDLIETCRKLLTQSEHHEYILHNLDYQIDHVLLDESQDTSLVQWGIIESICNEFFSGQSSRTNYRSLFVVGDVKQSIYSFQGASPTIFHTMQNHWSALAQNAQIITPNRNFRSTVPILTLVDAVLNSNNILQDILQNNNPDSTQKTIHHIPTRTEDAGRVELWPLAESPKKERSAKNEIRILDETPSPKQNGMEILAETIANTISDWIRNKRILPSKNRPIKPSDILILVGHRNQFMQYMIKYLKDNQINTAGPDKTKITENMAVMDLIKLTEFILNTQDDLSLAIVLKSPLFQLTESELFDLAYNRDEQTLWERLQEKAIPTTADHQALRYAKKLCDAKETIESLIAKSETITPMELYIDLINRNRSKILTALGKENNEYLDGLIKASCEFEKTNTPCLGLFLKWLKYSNYSIKCNPSQNQDNVRIMTIHGAKGLQSPIVFLADTTDIPQVRDEMIYDGPVPIWHKNCKSNYCIELKQREKERQYSEYLRKLYVALTRAEDELFITGWKQGKASSKCWYEIIENVMQDCESYESSLAPLHDKPTKIRFISREQIRKPQTEEHSLSTETEITLPQSLHEPITDKAEKKEAQNKSALKKKEVLMGEIAHKLLEYLPKQKSLPSRDNIYKYARQCLYNNQYPLELDDKIIHQVIKTVIEAMEHPEISELLSHQNVTELSIGNKVEDDGKIDMGRIDRLCFLENKILILDYKFRMRNESNENQARGQLSLYKKIIAKQFPSKKIECIIIWLIPPSVQRLR